MPDAPKESKPHVQDEIADLVRRSLVQMADMQTVSEELKEVSARISKMTPPPTLPPPPPEAEKE